MNDIFHAYVGTQPLDQFFTLLRLSSRNQFRNFYVCGDCGWGVLN